MEGGDRAVLIRTGGLGDFVLTLPFLAELRRRFAHVTVITHRRYWELIAGDGLADDWLSVDNRSMSTLWSIPEGEVARRLAGAELFLAWKDPDGSLARGLARAGVLHTCWLESRPGTAPHVTLRMFAAAGWEPPAGLLEQPVLARATAPRTGVLWLHPGSGASEKNAPVAWFAARAKAWLSRTGLNGVIISLGEADLALEAPMRELFAGLPHERLIMPSLRDLRRRLAGEALQLIGNDTGVTHLAAALGVPVEVAFRCTDDEVWRPIGRHVTIVHP